MTLYSVWGPLCEYAEERQKYFSVQLTNFRQLGSFWYSRVFFLILHVALSIFTNLFVSRTAPLRSVSILYDFIRESQLSHTRAGFQIRFPSQNYFQYFRIFQCTHAVPSRAVAMVIPYDCQRGAFQVLYYILSMSLWLCCVWSIENVQKSLSFALPPRNF